MSLEAKRANALKLAGKAMGGATASGAFERIEQSLANYKHRNSVVDEEEITHLRVEAYAELREQVANYVDQVCRGKI